MHRIIDNPILGDPVVNGSAPNGAIHPDVLARSTVARAGVRQCVQQLSLPMGTKMALIKLGEDGEP